MKTLRIPFLFLLPLVSLSVVGNATDFLVLNTGDTLYGVVTHADEKGVSPGCAKKIKLTEASGKQRKYKREEVSSFRSKNVDYEGFWLHQSSQGVVLLNPRYDINPQHGDKEFLRVVSKGSLHHYRWEWWEQGESTQLWMDLFKKEEDLFFVRATQGLLGLKRKVLADYLTDCPKLSELLQRKKLNEAWEVVHYYNSNCEG